VAEVSRFKALEERIRRSLGVEVWIDRVEDEEVPADYRPFGVWTRERLSGKPYVVFPCVGDDGTHIEPGDWILTALGHSFYEMRHRTIGGASQWIQQRIEARNREVQRKKQEAIHGAGGLVERLTDGMAHEAGASCNWQGVDVE